MKYLKEIPGSENCANKEKKNLSLKELLDQSFK
jgi:hypothetical protein